MTRALHSTVAIGSLEVRRPGFGAMHLTGPDCWGPPEDRDAAVAVARRAVGLGINFIDTADSYGTGANEELLADAMWPYPEDLVIATKAGQSRPSRSQWVPLGRPEYLRQQAELSLRRLRLERLDLFLLHRIDPKVPADEQFGALRQLQDEGKVRHVGLSEVTIEQLRQAQSQLDVVAVQNRYNFADRLHETVLDYCDAHEIAFIPWIPLAAGRLSAAGGVLDGIAREIGGTPAQAAIAWLLKRSPVMLPIPGTSSPSHLAENFAAASLTLSDEQFQRLNSVGKESGSAMA